MGCNITCIISLVVSILYSTFAHTHTHQNFIEISRCGWHSPNKGHTNRNMQQIKPCRLAASSPKTWANWCHQAIIEFLESHSQGLLKASPWCGYFLSHLCCNVAPLWRPCLRVWRVRSHIDEWSVGVSSWSTGLLPRDKCDSVAFAVVPRTSSSHLRRQAYVRMVFSVHEIWI